MNKTRAWKIFSDIVTMNMKFHIMIDENKSLWLVRSWTGDNYGEITISHAKRLINNSNKNN